MMMVVMRLIGLPGHASLRCRRGLPRCTRLCRGSRLCCLCLSLVLQLLRDSRGR